MRRLPFPDELAWLAGLLEGEGCFSWSKQHSERHKKKIVPLIVVGMTDRDVIEHVAKIWDRNVILCSPHKNRYGEKQMYQTRLYGKAAALLMAQLRPYMFGRRRAKIDEVLEQYANRRKRGGKNVE